MTCGGATNISSLSKELSALGPLFQVTERIVTLTAQDTSVTLCTANALRWALRIAAISSGTVPVFAAMNLAAIVASGGWPLVVPGGGADGTAIPFSLNVRQDGILTQQLWIGGQAGGASPVGAIVFTVWEVSLVPG